jgi:hypothetical protein
MPPRGRLQWRFSGRSRPLLQHVLVDQASSVAGKTVAYADARLHV